MPTSPTQSISPDPATGVRAPLPSLEFIDVVKAYGKILAQPPYTTIQGIETASCAAVRTAFHDGSILVTHRGADLAHIEQTDFLAIPHAPANESENTPPPHTAVLRALFDAIPNAKYMLFSDRGLLSDTPTSGKILPALATISKNILLPNNAPVNDWSVNTESGGFFIAASGLEFLASQTQKIRPAPTLAL